MGEKETIRVLKMLDRTNLKPKECEAIDKAIAAIVTVREVKDFVYKWEQKNRSYGSPKGECGWQE